MISLIDTQSNETLGRFETLAEARRLYLTMLRLHPPAADWLALVEEESMPAAAERPGAWRPVSVPLHAGPTPSRRARGRGARGTARAGRPGRAGHAALRGRGSRRARRRAAPAGVPPAGAVGPGRCAAPLPARASALRRARLGGRAALAVGRCRRADGRRRIRPRAPARRR